MIKQNFRLLVKNKIYLICFLSFAVFLTAILGKAFYDAAIVKNIFGAYDAAHDVFRKCAGLVCYYVIFMLFLSLYAFDLNRLQGTDEMVRSIDKKRELKGRRWALGIWNLFFTCLVLVIHAVAFSQSYFRHNMRFLFQIIVFIIFNYFAVGMVMITAAECISLISKIRYQILLAIPLSILFGGFFKERLYENIENEELFYKIYAWIQMITPAGGKWAMQKHIGQPVQLHQVGVILLWGAVFGLLISFTLHSRRRTWICMLFSAFLILALPYEEMGQSYYYGNGVGYPMYHYYEWIDNKNEPKIEQIEQSGGFEVSDYDMEFTVFTCLGAKVTMTPNKSELPQYIFTLYHPYHIMGICDQDGKKLNYERDGDYLTVYAPQDKSVRQITVSYYGNGAELYSQMAGINLLPGTCFYPVPGFHQLYGPNAYGIFEFSMVYLEKAANFRVRVRAIDRVYSTLPETDKNRFEGSGDAFGLFAGMLEKTVVGNTTFVYSSLEKTEQGGFSSWEDVTEYAALLYEKSGREELNLSGKTVVTLPTVSFYEPLAHGNYLLLHDFVQMGDLDYLRKMVEEEVVE
ncbi:MAG: hypothetical protein IJ711_09110 [Lachnospiraceae bacterium]|nr:hypothetical protein [Lachnospiraceae bacterium]